MNNKEPDMVNHPPHYKNHASGVECIDITEHMTFCLGNAIKYLWRSSEKGKEIEDLKKAVWYINREIERLQKCISDQNPTLLTHSNLDLMNSKN